MGWALWLAVPILPTCAAALIAWWRGLRAKRADQLDTDAAMRAHQAFLDALVLPARSMTRPTAVALPSGTVSVRDQPSGGHSVAG